MRDQFFRSMTIMKQINPTDAKPCKEAPRGNRMDVIVIGGVPGGYVAAIRAGQLGL